MYVNGSTIKEVSSVTGIYPKRISDYLHQAGLLADRVTYNPKKIISEYQGGMSINEIATENGIAFNTVRGILTKNNISLRKDNPTRKRKKYSVEKCGPVKCTPKVMAKCYYGTPITSKLMCCDYIGITGKSRSAICPACECTCFISRKDGLKKYGNKRVKVNKQVLWGQ